MVDLRSYHCLSLSLHTLRYLPFTPMAADSAHQRRGLLLVPHPLSPPAALTRAGLFAAFLFCKDTFDVPLDVILRIIKKTKEKVN